MKHTMEMTLKLTTEVSGQKIDATRLHEVFPKIMAIMKAGGTAGRFDYAFSIGDEGYSHVTVEFDTKAGPALRSTGGSDMRGLDVDADAYYRK